MRLLLVLTSALTIAACSGAPERERAYQITAYFPDSTELPVGSDVRIGGVSVGSVVDVSSSEGQLEATLEIKPEYAPIDENAQGILRQKTLLGDTYIELTSEAGETEATEPPSPGEVNEVFESLEPETRRAFKEWQREAAGMVGDDLQLKEQ